MILPLHPTYTLLFLSAGGSPAVVTNLVPVQITVPAQQAGGVPKAITIHVPSNALANGVAGLQLQAILSSPTAAQTFALEVCVTDALPLLSVHQRALLKKSGTPTQGNLKLRS